ncbi:MAG: hypothetical protein SNJ56_03115, partial [Termitinemataceae bacterium]
MYTNYIKTSYNNYRGLATIIVLISTLFTGCSLFERTVPVTPPATFQLSRQNLGYAVVQNTYTQLLDSCEASGVSLGILRQGTMLEILERRFVQTGGSIQNWIRVDNNGEKGWVREEVVLVFPRKEQALWF